MERATYTVPEVIEITGLSRTTIWTRIRSGELPSVKIAGRRMVTKHDLQRFLSGEPDTERKVN